MRTVIGLDLGTTAVKAVLVTEEGRILARAEVGHPLHTDAHGLAEQDAKGLARAAQQALAGVAGAARGTAVQAIVPSAAMHSVLLLDAAGEPLARAMTWADGRAGTTLPALRAALDPQASYAATGCPLQAPYHPARMWWLRAERPAIFARTRRVVSLTDWVTHDLTGQWATSIGQASTTGLWNAHTADWDAGILEALDLSPGQLPPVLDATQTVGHLRPALAAELGLPSGVPVLTGSTDGPLATLGVGVTAPGRTAVSVGTSGALRQVVPGLHLDPQARTWSYRLDASRHIAGGAVNNAGLLLEWVRGLCYADLEAQEGFSRLLADAARISPGAEGLVCLPYLTGERSPLWQPELRGSLHGLTPAHGRAHVARAALEALAFTLEAVGTALPGAGPQPVRLTGGLARSSLWQALLADVLDRPVQVVEAQDAAALGAARLVFPDADSASGTSPVVWPAQAALLRGARGRWQDTQAGLGPSAPALA